MQLREREKEKSPSPITRCRIAVWNHQLTEIGYQTRGGARRARSMSTAAARAVPKLHRKLVAVTLSNRFRDVVRVQTTETPRPGRGELLVRMKYVGINASDIN